MIALACGTDRTSAFRELIEGPATLSIHGVFPGECLPATNGDIDITRFNVHGIGAPADPLGRHNGRP